MFILTRCLYTLDSCEKVKIRIFYVARYFWLNRITVMLSVSVLCIMRLVYSHCLENLYHRFINDTVIFLHMIQSVL